MPTGDNQPDAFDVHRQMVIALFGATLLLGAVLGTGILLARVTALIAVAAAGALGGFVSALRRLYAFQRVFPADFFSGWRRISLYLVIYSMIPPLVGAIAAITIYLVFAAGLIEGDMFPKFQLLTGNPRAEPFDNFVNNWAPIASADYAKAIVWGFVAGFSERFVPDLLDRLSNKEGEQKRTKEG